MRTALRLLQLCLVAFLAFYSSPVSAQEEEDTVEWLDNYDKAVLEAKRTNKTIFLEFRCEA